MPCCDPVLLQNYSLKSISFHFKIFLQAISFMYYMVFKPACLKETQITRTKKSINLIYNKIQCKNYKKESKNEIKVITPSVVVF